MAPPRMIQPLITPLYATRTAHALLARWRTSAMPDDRDLVRQTWQRHASRDFEAWWRRSLEKGVIADTARGAR